MTITVSLNQDTVVEGEEEFGAIISLQGAIPGVQLGSDTASATIADDDGKGEARKTEKHSSLILLTSIPSSCYIAV